MAEHDRVTERIIAGAMSGTSADGVDIAITRITGSGLDMSAELVRHHHRPYTTELRREIFAFRSGEVRDNALARLAKMGREISLTCATAVNEALAGATMSADQLAAVAAHGQTLFHDPPDTIQWFDPSLVAAEVGCKVVSDFRRADLAAGGQGAPLVPFADYILFRHPTKNRVLLNIGGIANITAIPAGASIDQVVACDTGPGNCISDWLMRRYADLPFDKNGDRAMAGRALKDHAKLGAKVLSDPYFEKPAPKSTDTPQMIELFRSAVASAEKTLGDLALEYLLACACAITVTSVMEGIEIAIGWRPNEFELIASGGGIHNRCIMAEFDEWNQLSISTEIGMLTEAKEAVAFALLAAATLDGVPSNVPSVTGAKRAVVLGSITPKP